jgi:hypothetical protein
MPYGIEMMIFVSPERAIATADALSGHRFVGAHYS